ncbi:hypothetical protein PG990_014420 [Apiospora arundinis]
MPPDREHTRPALGQVADLGTLYDAHKDTFHNANVIQGNPPPAAISIDKIGSHSVELATADTTKDRLASFVPTAGSARYLEHSQHNEGAPVGAVVYEVLTEGLHDHITTRSILDSRSTHIVTGITYGIKVILTARHVPSNEDDQQQDIMKKLDLVKSMFSQHNTLFTGGISEEPQCPAANEPPHFQLGDLRFVLFSDFSSFPRLIGVKPVTAKKIIDQIPSLLRKTNHGRGVPLTYHLLPLDYLRRMRGLQFGPVQSIRQPPNWVTDEFALTWEKWNNIEPQIQSVIRGIDSIGFMLKGTGLSSIATTSSQLSNAIKAKEELRRNYSATLELLRAGTCPSDSLEKLLNNHLTSDNSPEHTLEMISRVNDNVRLRKALASRGGHYFDYEDAQNAMLTSNSIYILFFTEAMRKDGESWKESQDVITRLLNRNSGDYTVAVAECQSGELSFSRPRISHYSLGKLKTANMLESMDLADQCFVRRGFNSEAPEVQPAPLRTDGSSDCHVLILLATNRWPMTGLAITAGVSWNTTRSSSIATADDSSWQCNAETHGKKFVKWDSQELETKLVSLSSYKDMNILVLGESGVGKSTFINAFYNYMMFDSLDNAMDHEKLEYAIPSSFTIQHFDEDNPRNGFVECNVKIGQDEEEQDGSAGQSATQSPAVYRLQIGDRLVRLIDTPGIGDTRGEDFDKINMSKVLSTLNRFSNLHGVIILLKPNNARLNVVFKFCVQELLTHLHRDAVRNIIWGFTNTRQSNYGPGDSMKPLKTLLAKHASLGLRLTPKNVFCFDSESFRCLAAKKQADYTMNNLDDFRRSWDRSAKQTTALLEHVEIDVQRLDEPRTVCKHPDCVEMVDVAGIKRPLYKSMCHDPCYLTDVDEDVVGHSNLLSCVAFRGNYGYCKECDHYWHQHLHIRYMQTERTVLDIDPHIQAKLDANASDVVLKKLGVKSLNNKITDSLESLMEVQDAAINFGLYLKKKSIAPYNDAMIEYLDVLINDEKRQISHCNACGEDTKKNEERLESLKQNKERYGHRIKVLDAEMSKSDENAQLLTEEGVDELVQKLCNLKHYGKDLKAMMEMAEWSKASGFREQELRPRLARNASNLSWMSPVSNVASAMKNTVLGAASSMAGGLLGRRSVNPREPPSPSPRPKPSSSHNITRPNDSHKGIKVEDNGPGTYEPRGTKRGHAQTAAGTRPEGRYSLRERKRRVTDWVANVERET